MTNCNNCDCEQEKHRNGIGKCSSRVMGIRDDIEVAGGGFAMGIMDCKCEKFEEPTIE